MARWIELMAERREEMSSSDVEGEEEEEEAASSLGRATAMRAANCCCWLWSPCIIIDISLYLLPAFRITHFGSKPTLFPSFLHSCSCNRA